MHLLIELKDLRFKSLQQVTYHVLAHVSPLFICHCTLFSVCKTPFKSLNAAFIVLVEILEELNLFLILLSKPYYLVEEDSTLFLLLYPLKVVIVELILKECSHLG